jgi:excinuclease UvrABC nuclease subunit
LKPELAKQLAAPASVASFRAIDLQNDPNAALNAPGVYVIRSEVGYLYIGEAKTLRKRVSKHLDHSARKLLPHYSWESGLYKMFIDLHIFQPKSNARLANYRRAYERSLIESRRPLLNIQGSADVS